MRTGPLINGVRGGSLLVGYGCLLLSVACIGFRVGEDLVTRLTQAIGLAWLSGAYFAGAHILSWFEQRAQRVDEPVVARVDSVAPPAA